MHSMSKAECGGQVSRAAVVLCTGLWTLLWPAAGAADAADAELAGTEPEAGEATGVLLEAAGGPAWFKGDPGVWLEALVARAFPIASSTGLALGGGLILTQVSETDEQDFNGDRVEDTEVEDTIGFGVALRGYLDQRLATWLVGRIGIALGVQHVRMESPYCGDVNATALMYGVFGGPVVLLSPRVELGLTVDLVQYPRNACSPLTDEVTGVTRPTTFRQAFFDPGDFDGTVTLLGRVGYLF